DDARRHAATLSLEGVAQRITCPILIMNGRLDRIVPCADAERLAREVTGPVELLIIEDGNHIANNRAYRWRPLGADWMAEQLSALCHCGTRIRGSAEGSRMTIFNVGRATVARVEEVYGPTYRATDIFPELSPDILNLHAPWLAPHHYEAETGLIKLSIHSWLLQIGGQKILIDACCGNQKNKPGRPFWHMMNTNY